MKISIERLKQLIKEEFEKQFGEYLPRDLIIMGAEVLRNPNLECEQISPIYADISAMVKKLEKSAEGGWGMPDELERLAGLRNEIRSARGDCVPVEDDDVDDHQPLPESYRVGATRVSGTKQVPSYIQAKEIYDKYNKLRRHIQFKNEESTRLYYELQKDISNLQYELWLESGKNT